MSEEALAELSKAVVANPQVYGPLISSDMKTALIKAQLNEGALDYEKTFAQLQQLRADYAREGVNIYATGQPVLVGWAYHYKDQIFQILVFTALIMVALLIFHFRSWYGVLVPLAGVLVSTTLGHWDNFAVWLQPRSAGSGDSLSNLGAGDVARCSAGRALLCRAGRSERFS